MTNNEKFNQLKLKTTNPRKGTDKRKAVQYELFIRQ